MVKLNDEMKETFAKVKLFPVATASKIGVPNVAPIAFVMLVSDDTIWLADNYMNKTRANVLAGSRGSLLFITKDGDSYQVKGRLEYLRDGEVYADMKKWNPAKHPGHAAVALRVDEAYSGGKKLL